ncbi:MAG: DNA cytosine methyltransferase [Pyrinomonadaceae bacterium]|nr:DNA cytosine methyltransferase [Pyrinomonadaceae bacterium]
MITAIDFFCGAGGLTHGLLSAGIKVLAGVDVDSSLRLTYEKNNHGAKFVCRDARKINIHALRRFLGITSENRVLYTACTPCQPFSTLNQRQGADDRKDLLVSFGDIVKQAPPDVILIENVPGLNTKYGREIYERFLARIKDAGFPEKNIFSAFLDANDYDVPQTRKRFILIASRHSLIKPPIPVTNKPVVRTYLEKYPEIEHGQKSNIVPNHEARRLQPHLLKIVQAVPKNGGSRNDILDTSILLKCHQKKPMVHKDVFGRMRWDSPAPTLTARCTDVYCGRFTHPDQDRGISVREAAALQTFPDDYVFYGNSILHLARQIGNSVPVNFAKALGKSIKTQFDGS